MTSDIPKHAYIDALRGYAILGVLLVHASQAVAPVNSTLQRLMSGGLYGVQLFYIVSALTLCLSWNARSAHEKDPVRNFFLRRWFRIAPLFYLAIALYVGLYGLSPRPWAPNGVEWWFIPLTVLFLHGFHPESITSVVPGGWSIAVEMSFYLVLPILLSRFASIQSHVIFFGASIAAYVFSIIVFDYLWSDFYPMDQQYLVSAFTYLNFFGQLPVLAMGLLAYHALENRDLRRWVIGGALTFLLCILLSRVLPTSSILHVVPSHVVMGGVFALLALTLARFPLRILVNQPIIQIGKISFSMYLLHFAVIELYQRLGVVARFPMGNGSSILFYLCIVATTAPVAYLTFVWIERRGVIYGNRLIATLEQGTQRVQP